MRRAEEMKQISSSKADSAADTSLKTSQSSQSTNCKLSVDRFVAVLHSYYYCL